VQAPWLFDPAAVRVIYPVHDFTLLYLGDFVLSSETFLKPIQQKQLGYFEKAIKKRRKMASNTDDDNLVGSKSKSPFPKESFLFYPAVISENHGQLRFVKHIDPSVLKRHRTSLVFAGRPDGNDTVYWPEVQRLLDEKDIEYRYLGFVDKETISDFYVRAKGVVSYSMIMAPGPRVIYEALYGNTPYFVSDYVKLDMRIRPLGMTVKINQTSEETERLEFNSKLDAFLSHDWGDEPIKFAKRYLTIGAFDALFEEIECFLAKKRRFDS